MSCLKRGALYVVPSTWCSLRGAPYVVRSSWAANTSAARRQVRAGCADRVSRKEAKTQRRQELGNTVTELVERPFTWCLLRGAVLLGRKHERSEASSARGMRGRLRGQRPRRTAPPLRGQRPRRTAPRLRGQRPRKPTPR